MIKHKRSLMAMGLGLAVGLPLSGLSGLALAQNPELPAAQLAALKQKLAQRLPQLPPIDGARQTSMPGVIEVRSGGNIFYTDANGDHLIDGQMIDTRSQRNLTEERLEVLNRVVERQGGEVDAVEHLQALSVRLRWLRVSIIWPSMR